MNLNQRQNHEKQTQNAGMKNQDLDSIAVSLGKTGSQQMHDNDIFY